MIVYRFLPILCWPRLGTPATETSNNVTRRGQYTDFARLRRCTGLKDNLWSAIDFPESTTLKELRHAETEMGAMGVPIVERAAFREPLRSSGELVFLHS